MSNKDLRINDKIRVKEIRLIKDDGSASVIPLSEALKMADELSLDLVEINPNSTPPVCKILNYGKYKFEQERKQKEAKKKQKVIKLKEVRMQAKIDKHDIEVKSKHIKEFLEEGNKVKVTVRFRGRELAHTEIGKEVLEKILDILKENCQFNLEASPRMEGRNMYMMLSSKI